MDKDDFLKKFQNLPREVKEILLMEESSETNVEMIKKFNLSEEQRKDFFAIIRGIALKEILLDKILDEVKARLGLDEEKAKSLTCDLLGLRFLPLQFYLGNVEKHILAFKGDLGFYQQRLEEIFSLQNQLKSFVDLLIGKFNLSDFSDEHKKRLANLLISRLEFRTKEKIEQRLVHPFEQGGMGLDSQKAKEVANEIERMVNEEEITKEDIEKAREKREMVLKRTEVFGNEK